MSLESALGSNLYAARTRKGLKQAQVAESVSISVRWYQQLEKGTHMPSATVLLRLQVLLNLDPNDLKEEVGLREPLFLPQC